MAGENWLVRILTERGVTAAADIKVTSGMRTADVWEAAARVTGLTEQQIAEHVAQRMRLRVADMEQRDNRATRLIPDRVARAHDVLPVRENDRQLFAATYDPNDFEAEQALGFASGRQVVFEIAAPRALQRALRTAYPAEAGLDELLSRVDDAVADAVRVVEDVGPEDVHSRELQTPPIVKLTNLIISEAIREDASDIHIEGTAGAGVVRFRMDGVLRQYMQIPAAAVNRVLSRVKVIGQMDIDDRVRPQDGRARVVVGGAEYDLRISTVPASGSEKAVIRILYPNTATKLDDLKLPAREVAQIRRLLSLRDGIVVVTGPTGSGKTTTLYAALRELATGKVNITTVEDPVEYELGGVTQIQVETKRVTFASALRAILRQDPDIVLVGEIRDSETAQIALQAALTGHLILATLPTNDAPAAVSRLLDLGLDPRNLAAALRGVVAQRLLRRVCAECARPVTELNAEELKLAQQYRVQPKVRAMGCERCAGSGYRGRVPIVEVLTSVTAIEDAIGASAPAIDIRRLAMSAGMRGMIDGALERVTDGVTTLQEIERVLGAAVDAPSTVESAPARPAVLLVDDDEIVREIAAETLMDSGFDIVQAGDGVEAIEKLRERNFSLVLLDLDMPRLGGLQLLRRLRAQLATSTLPIIILTADRDAEITVMDEGADDYLSKPLDPPRLVSRVKAVLRRRSA